MVSPHTDVSVLTILIYDGNCAILQRQDLDGTWKDVVLGNSHSSNECQLRFIVNIGDCISDMTGGALKSTLHRVVRNPNKCAKASRFCLAFFLGFASDAVVRVGKKNNRLAMTFEEWRKQRIQNQCPF